MKRYSYAELVPICKHDLRLAKMLEEVVDTALETVLVAVRRGGRPNTLHRLAVALEELNSHLQTLEGQGFLVDSRTLQDQDKLAVWAGEMVFEIYRNRS